MDNLLVSFSADKSYRNQREKKPHFSSPRVISTSVPSILVASKVEFRRQLVDTCDAYSRLSIEYERCRSKLNEYWRLAHVAKAQIPGLKKALHVVEGRAARYKSDLNKLNAEQKVTQTRLTELERSLSGGIGGNVLMNKNIILHERNEKLKVLLQREKDARDAAEGRLRLEYDENEVQLVVFLNYLTSLLDNSGLATSPLHARRRLGCIKTVQQQLRQNND